MSFINKTLPTVLAGSMLLASQAYGADAINVTSWGGAWSAAFKSAWTDPYEQETGQKFNFIDYNGGVAEVRAQFEAGNVTWDIVDMIPSDLSTACGRGLPRGARSPRRYRRVRMARRARTTGFPVACTPCGVGGVVWATIMAYKDPTYQGTKPTSVADFWDFGKFPGKRSLRKVAEVNLEWALVADGVSLANVYDVLGTSEGVDRAFAKARCGQGG